MACAVPVVASDVGGLPELIIEGETGFLCPIDDIDALTARTRSILTNDDLQKAIAEKSRKRAVEKFDVARIVPMYEKYYQKFLSVPV